MRFEHFDLNLLVMLDALLDEQNVTRAAKRVHLSQSAASAALKRLRDYFGDELLVPVGGRLMPTPLARSLRDPVRAALLQVHATITRQPEFDPATARREFTLWCSDYAAAVLIVPFLRQVALEAPGVVLHLQNTVKDVFDRFDRGVFDLVVLPEAYISRLDAPSERLFTDDHVCLFDANHPDIGESLTFEHYLALGHVDVRLDLPGEEGFAEWLFHGHSHLRRIEASVDTFGLLPQVLVGTRRITVIYRRLAEHAARQLPLRMLPTPAPTPQLVEFMAWPRHVDGDPAHRWLRALLRAAATELA